MVAKSGNGDRSPTSAPLVHDLLPYLQRGSARVIGDMLQFYCRLIKNVLGIWLVDPEPAKDHRKWTAFILLMQDYYRIKWIFEEHSNTVNFMDMTISIREDQIVTSSYEKYEKMDELIFIYSAPFHPSPWSVNWTRFW